jgi:glyoxylase-like metal-dependent hydrolase (beta-lactamase superfamily II)
MSSDAPDNFLVSRQIGNVTVSIISDASGLSTIIKQLDGVPEEVWRHEVEADANGEVRLGYNVAHVRLGDASILIDLGFDDPSPTSQWKAPRHLRTPGVPAGLAELGVQPEAITHVLITHAHGDHIAGGSVLRNGERVPRYPNARHVLGRADWEGNPDRNRPDSHAALHLATIDRSGLLELVAGEREIVPGVTLIPAPGESPGHSIVRVQSVGETFYFLGDLFHHPCEVAHLDWVAQGRDAAAMRASRERLVADARATNALLVATHIPFPPFGRIEATAAGPRWQIAAD